MLSQGHMGAPLYHYTRQVDPRFGDSWSLEEWKWCHYVMVEADVHLRPLHASPLCIYKVFELLVCDLKGMLVPLIPLHRPSWPQIWGFRFTWGVKMMPQRHVLGWYLPQTPSSIHIMHIQSVLVIGMLSQGQGHVSAPLYHYTGQVGPRIWEVRFTCGVKMMP
jgi:hypothetical protein